MQDYSNRQGRSEGGPGVPVTPLPSVSLSVKQITYNIPWRKRHDDNVWHSVTPPPPHPTFEKSWLRPWIGRFKKYHITLLYASSALIRGIYSSLLFIMAQWYSEYA